MKAPRTHHRIILLAALFSALLVTTCAASPLPIPEPSKLVSGTANTSLVSTEGKLLVADEERGFYSDTRQAASVEGEHYLNEPPFASVPMAIQPQDSRLDSRAPTGKPNQIVDKLNNGLNRFFSSLSSKWLLLGFAYTKPGQERGQGNKIVDLHRLSLPAMRLESIDSSIYLLTRLGMQDQNPDNQYSSCVVYAKKSEMNELPQMFYEEFTALPAYDELTLDLNEPLPVYSTTPAPGHRASDPSTLGQTSSSRADSIKFFNYRNFQDATAMEIPKEYIRKWKMFGLCYTSESDSIRFLPKKAELKEWKSKIREWPEHREI
ncbi:hypothetical protein F5050DRAFT_1121715 [Lentinula boryana]|uniref:Secreted protein n=1 Tax=Lentinula boryana TaxID=40481 RepID=A0ABQ8QK59_9AGAR|nr:hypothetical protein F5050DRAFT_1121715 [Lentinula boryana]